jgi:hypothetical protein
VFSSGSLLKQITAIFYRTGSGCRSGRTSGRWSTALATHPDAHFRKGQKTAREGDLLAGVAADVFTYRRWRSRWEILLLSRRGVEELRISTATGYFHLANVQRVSNTARMFRSMACNGCGSALQRLGIKYGLSVSSPSGMHSRSVVAGWAFYYYWLRLGYSQ